jgi:hypothetical protein
MCIKQCFVIELFIVKMEKYVEIFCQQNLAIVQGVIQN